MGVMCQGCEFRKKDIEKEFEKSDKPSSKIEELKLPKQYVSTINFTQRSEEEEAILKKNKEE